MSETNVPYHLRTNKAIDRRIFFDLLSHLSTILPNRIQEYKYVSMGGPMLEDQYLLHHELGMRNLHSIERDDAALSRQNYNKPYGCIECTKNSTKDYISDFDEDDPVVIWLDYTDTKWQSQFSECSDLLNDLKPHDILKVTFNANPDVLNQGSEKTPLSVFKEKANHRLLSENLNENDVKTMPAFAKTILDLFQSMAEDVLSGEGVFFYPIAQFRYIDNRHQMLTITGIVLEDDSDFTEKIVEHTESINWPYLHNKWGDIECIEVPDLTLKERQAINSLIPLKTGVLKPTDLPFSLDKNSVKASKMINNYIKYYRYIPNFLRVVI